MNGEELAGKVTEIGEDDVKFTYAGETVVYKLKKSDIIRFIIFLEITEITNRKA
jgi:preprotein translocase subunit YajC